MARGEQPYTREWMEQTFETFWQYGQQAVTWTNSLLSPPPPHVLELLGAAGQCPPLASAIANGFDNPPDYFPWRFEAGACRQFIASNMAASA